MVVSNNKIIAGTPYKLSLKCSDLEDDVNIRTRIVADGQNSEQIAYQSDVYMRECKRIFSL